MQSRHAGACRRFSISYFLSMCNLQGRGWGRLGAFANTVSANRRTTDGRPYGITQQLAASSFLHSRSSFIPSFLHCSIVRLYRGTYAGERIPKGPPMQGEPLKYFPPEAGFFDALTAPHCGRPNTNGCRWRWGQRSSGCSPADRTSRRFLRSWCPSTSFR